MSDRRSRAKPIKLIYECRNGREIVLRLPTKMSVCPTCEGRGKYVNPAIDSNGISREDFEGDPDFEESYFRGAYDVTCGECLGRNVVEVVDERFCLTSSQKRRLRMFRYQQDELAEYDREARVTEYWESGGLSGSRY